MKYPHRFVVDGPLSATKHPCRKAIGSGQVSSKPLLVKLALALEAAGFKVIQVNDTGQPINDVWKGTP